MISIQGKVERVTFQNPNNHYTIAKLSTRGAALNVTLVGIMAGVRPGQALKVTGKWETHPKYGDQFKVQTFEVVLPDTVEGIRRYLESGAVKGVGAVMANRLVNRFGSDTLRVIQKEPERLSEVEGVGPRKAALIHHWWREHRIFEEIMHFLQDHGVKTDYSARVFSEYGEDAVAVMTDDPYQLAEDLPGIGFMIADAITLSEGAPPDDPRRIGACLRHILEQSASEGHVMLPGNKLYHACSKQFGIEKGAAEDGLHSLVDAREVVVETGDTADDDMAVYTNALYQAETGIADRLAALSMLPLAPEAWDPDHVAAKVVQKLALNLSEEQLSVLTAVMGYRTAVITGGPGTGKTTLIRSIQAVFRDADKKVLLAAPTGRAARRLAELTGRDARTVHRLLGYNPQENCFDKNQDDPLDAHVIIIDEASMLDTALTYHLLLAVPLDARLILVGDVFQLPSVGPGSVLEEFIRSNHLPVFALTRIFRQGDESPIITTAHTIRKGGYPDIRPSSDIDGSSEFYFIPEERPEIVAQTVIRLCSTTLPDRFSLDPIADIQVMTPMHKGVVGTLQLNSLLQKALNPGETVLEHGASTFKTGDKVMHLKNNYQKDVFNGDIGRVVGGKSDSGCLIIDYYGREVEYGSEELNDLTLAYAISVHKAQGSEYPAVVIPLTTRHYPLLQRNLLYTAITRGQQLVILLGSPRALDIALKNDQPRHRHTRLARRLQQACGDFQTHSQ